MDTAHKRDADINVQRKVSFVNILCETRSLFCVPKDWFGALWASGFFDGGALYQNLKINGIKRRERSTDNIECLAMKL